jgi:hypothetical protein
MGRELEPLTPEMFNCSFQTSPPLNNTQAPAASEGSKASTWAIVFHGALGEVPLLESLPDAAT